MVFHSYVPGWLLSAFGRIRLEHLPILMNNQIVPPLLAIRSVI